MGVISHLYILRTDSVGAAKKSSAAHSRVKYAISHYSTKATKNPAGKTAKLNYPNAGKDDTMIVK